MNLAQLERRCLMPIEEYEGEWWSVPGQEDEHYRFIDNSRDILAVAHLDHHSDNKSFGAMMHDGQHKAFFGGMDDRVGAYAILDAIPALVGKDRYDVLLTDHEEVGRSTARIFIAPRKYKWMFEFDREGLDCATYDYGTDELDKELKRYGWNPVRGSSTDICHLYKLGCRGFNFGNGNYMSHSQWNHIVIAELDKSIEQFAKWFSDKKETTYAFDETKDRRAWSGTVATAYQYADYEGFGYGIYPHGGYQDNFWETHKWDNAQGRYIPKSAETPKGQTGNNSQAKNKHHKRRSYTPHSNLAIAGERTLFGECDECGEYAELEPALEICRKCLEPYLKEGIAHPVYQWRYTNPDGSSKLYKAT